MKCSEMFWNVQKCCKMFRNVVKCSEMCWNVEKKTWKGKSLTKKHISERLRTFGSIYQHSGVFFDEFGTTGKVEICIFLVVVKRCETFKNVVKCSEMLSKGSEMLWKCLWNVQKCLELFRNVVKMFRNVVKCTEMSWKV